MTGFMADFDADLARPFGVAVTVGSTVSRKVLQVVTVTTSGNVTVPTGAAIADIDATAGGAGPGAPPGTGILNGAGGGGGGALDSAPAVPVVAGQSLTVTIGAGGTAASNSTTPGGAGGSTTVVNALGVVLATANGGLPGNNATTSGPGTGGLGGAPSTAPGHYSVAGGTGGRGTNNNDGTNTAGGGALSNVGRTDGPGGGGGAGATVVGGTYGYGATGQYGNNPSSSGSAGIVVITFRTA